MSDIVIASAVRTPVGAFLGGFSGVPAAYLGTAAIKEALKRAKVDPEEVDEAIMGQILTAGQGQNPARQAAVDAGIPVEKNRTPDQSALRFRTSHGCDGYAGDRARR